MDSSSQLDRRDSKEGERSTERSEVERIRAQRRYINPVRMNLADRLKARGTNESRTGAISVTEARCVRMRVCVRSIRGPGACVPVELGGKANKTYASFIALERRFEQRPLISRAVNRDFFFLADVSSPTRFYSSFKGIVHSLHKSSANCQSNLYPRFY